MANARVKAIPKAAPTAISDDELITMWGLIVEGFAAATDDLRDQICNEFQLADHWFEVLLRLARTPGHALPMSQIANEVSFSSGGFTKLADRLAEAGYVQRTPCPNDRRVTWMELTPTGVQLINVAMAQHAALLRSRIVDRIGLPALRAASEAIGQLRDPSKSNVCGAQIEARAQAKLDTAQNR